MTRTTWECEYRRPPRWSVYVVGLLWVGGAVAAFTVLSSAGAVPGRSLASPSQWPMQDVVRRSPGEETGIVFLHPKCPCSRATIRQLELALAERDRPLDVHVVFVAPTAELDRWRDSEFVAAARRLPHSTLHWDDGSLAKLFGAQTSGHFALYDADGRLQLTGGVTPSRGHEGPNTGAQAVARDERPKPTTPTRTPVFGCPLKDENQATPAVVESREAK